MLGSAMRYTVRIAETDLVPHVLRLLDEPEHRETGLGVGELDRLLRDILHPTGQDLAWLEGRYDDRFSQKVRNLRCHRTLERPGLAEFVDGEGGGRFHITEAGKAYLHACAVRGGPEVQLALDLR